MTTMTPLAKNTADRGACDASAMRIVAANHDIQLYLGAFHETALKLGYRFCAGQPCTCVDCSKGHEAACGYWRDAPASVAATTVAAPEDKAMISMRDRRRVLAEAFSMTLGDDFNDDELAELLMKARTEMLMALGRLNKMIAERK